MFIATSRQFPQPAAANAEKRHTNPESPLDPARQDSGRNVGLGKQVRRG